MLWKEYFKSQSKSYHYSPSQGEWVLNGYFFQLAHFLVDMKHEITTRWLAIAIVTSSSFLELNYISYSLSK